MRIPLRLSRLFVLVLLWGLVSSAACTAEAGPPPPPPSATPRMTATARSGATAEATPTIATTAPAAPATASAQPSPEPTPPLSQPWLPPNWIANPAWGGPEPGRIFSVARGYVTAAARHPTQPILALGRVTGLYLCHQPDTTTRTQPVDCFAFLPHTGWIGAVAFSPDGTHLATLDSHNTVRVWAWDADPPQAQTLTTDIPTLNGMGQLAFSDDGRYLALAGLVLQVWDLASGEALPPMDRPLLPALPINIAFEPGTHRLAVQTWEGHLGLLDLDASQPTWQAIYTPAPDEMRRPLGLAYAAEAAAPTLLAVYWTDDPNTAATRVFVEAWAHGNAQRAAVPYEEDTFLAFSRAVDDAHPQFVVAGPTGQILASGGKNAVYAYRLDDLTLTRPFTPPQAGLDRSLRALFYDAANDQVIAVWAGGSVSVWEGATGTLVGWAPDAGDLPIDGLGFDPLGRFLALLPYQQPAIFYPAPGQLGTAAPTGAAALMVPSTGCHLLFYHASSGPSLSPQWRTVCALLPGPDAPESELPEIAADVAPVSLAATDWVALWPRNGSAVELWDPFRGTLVRTLEVGAVGEVSALAASPDGRRLFVGGEDGRIGVWDPLTGELVATWRIDAPTEEGASAYDRIITALAVSADGQRLAAVRRDAMLAMWDLTTGERLGTWPLADLTGRMLTDDPIDWLHLSHDARFVLLSAAHDRKIVLADLEQGAGLARWQPVSGGQVTAKAVSPDDRLLAYGGGEGAVLVYDLGAALADALDPANMLPLPRLADITPELGTFHSRYTVALTVQAREIPVLEVTTVGQMVPWRQHIRIQGPGWHEQGEGVVEAGVAGQRFRREGERTWQMALRGDFPPTAPMVRAWPWRLAGPVEGGYRYTSQDPAAAVLPPATWLRRALQAEAAVFTPHTFDGQVDLTPQGVWVRARFVWDGDLWVDGESTPARLTVTYEAGDFGAPVTFPGDEGAAATPSSSATDAAIIDQGTGLPLPPQAVATDSEGVYQVNMPEDQVVAWYEAYFAQAGYQVQFAGRTALQGMPVYQFTVAKDGGLYEVWISGQGAFSIIALMAK